MKTNHTKSIRILDRKIWWIFAFSLVALLLFFVVLSQQKKQQEVSWLWITNTHHTIRKIDTASLLLTGIESSVRNYITTKDTLWIRQVHGFHSHLAKIVSALHTLTADNPAQQFNIKKLRQLSNRQRFLHDQLLSGSFTQSVLFQKVNTNEEIIQVTLSIRQLLGSISGVEEDQLAIRLIKDENDYKTSIYTAFLGSLFAFCLVLAILFKLSRDIYRRKKAEEEIAANEEKYRNLIENAGVVMYTADKNGMITFTNKRVAELTGYTVQELFGKHFSTLLDPAWTKEVIKFYNTQLTNTETTTYLEFQIRTKTGEQKWVEQAAQLLFDNDHLLGFQCMVKDVTEKKRIEEELNQSEVARKENAYRLTSILENTTALVFIKNLSGQYLMANRRFKEAFNLTDETVLNKTDYDFSIRERADHYKQMDEEVIRTLKPVQSEELVETAEGRRNLLLIKFPLFDDRHQVFGISGIATDITEKVQSHQQLEIAYKKAEEAKELQEQFLSNMSHEIRTPLNGIQGMTALLMKTALNDEQKKFTANISRSLHNLVAIVNNILDFSNIKTGKLSLQKIVFNIPEVMDAVKNQFAYQLQKKGLVLETIIDGAISQVVGDPSRLKQVLINLVDNAVKFTDSGHIYLEAGIQKQTADAAEIYFLIKDNGIGIAENKFETIFKSFAQANIDISSGYGGAGLGLAISKGLIEIQGGEISVQSKLGEGSVFRFFIPYSLNQDTATPAVQYDFNEQLKGKHFLVVEDNPVNQQLIDFVLKKVGSLVDIASNGKEAIDILQKNTSYDLIIMDVQMPVMGGYEASLYIRETLQLQTPIIALTAAASKEDQARCSEAGMNDFILKPFDFKDLYSRLIRLLNEPPPNQTGFAQKPIVHEKLYNLSLLEELEDKKYVVDMLSFFLDNTPEYIKELELQAQQKELEALYKTAHKIKGAVGMLQSTRLAGLLAKIESDARESIHIETIGEQVKEAVLLFRQMEQQLQQELEQIKKELTTSG
jgi:PAS domain S-box-containing protein